MAKKKLSVNIVARDASELYLGIVDQIALQAAKKAWAHGRKFAAGQKLGPHNVYPVYDRAKRRIELWASPSSRSGPIIEPVEKFLGSEDDPKPKNVGIAIIGARVQGIQMPALGIARWNMLADVQSDAESYLLGMREPYEK